MSDKIQKLKQDFIRYFRDGAKPRADWRVGIEIELFGFDAATKQRLDNRQVQTTLAEIADSKDELKTEDDLIVSARTADGGSWTVEPGGQLEFSSAPRENLSLIERDLRTNLNELRAVGKQNEFRFLALGFDPLRRIDEQKWFMKPRYKLMKPYLRTRGKRAWDMMTRTCSIQVSLDYADEPDLIEKFTVANRLAPVVTAIFANSPFVDGKANDLKSNRQAAWLETDADRCLVSPLAAQDEFSLDDFVAYALEVPMLFVRKNGGYSPEFTGKTFREFLSNAQIEPTVRDFQNHLTTIFTETRLKNYIEMRSADCGDLEHALAVAALWKGLFYDATALDAAFKIAPKLSAREYYELQKAVAENGLRAVWKNVSVLNLAKQIVRLAVEGLNRTAPEETKYLEILQRRVLLEEKAPADRLLENWDDSIEKVFELTAI